MGATSSTASCRWCDHLLKDQAREGLLKEFDERIYGAKPPLLALARQPSRR